MRTTRAEQLLFQEKNGFMYDVFLTSIQTSMGTHFVRTHENTRNAQGVWRDYCAYMEGSTKVELQVSKLMSDLISKKLDNNYKGTSQKYENPLQTTVQYIF